VEDVEKLRSQVVRSPQKLQKSLVDKGENLRVKTVDVEQMSITQRALQVQREGLTKLARKLVKRTESIKAATEEQSRNKKVQKENQEKRNQVENNEKVLAEKAAYIKQLKGSTQTAQSKAYRLQKEREEKSRTALLVLNKAMGEKEELSRKLIAELAKAKYSDSICERKLQELSIAEHSHIEEIEALRKKQLELEEAVSLYHKRTLAAIKK